MDENASDEKAVASDASKGFILKRRPGRPSKRKLPYEAPLITVPQKRKTWRTTGPASAKRKLGFDVKHVSVKERELIVKNQPYINIVKCDKNLDDRQRQQLEAPKRGSKKTVQIASPTFVPIDDGCGDDDFFNENDDQVEEIGKSVVCRVCGVAGAKRTSLVGAIADKLDLRKHLAKYLDIKVVLEENLPLNICELCKQTVIKFDKFYKRSVTATNRLNAIIGEESVDKAPWYEDNVRAKSRASDQYLLEKGKGSIPNISVKKVYFPTTNIEKLFGENRFQNLSSLMNKLKEKPEASTPRKPPKKVKEDDDDVQIVSCTEAKPSPVLKPINPKGEVALKGNTILIPLSNFKNQEGKGAPQYIIATPQQLNSQKILIPQTSTSKIVLTPTSSPTKITTPGTSPKIILAPSTPAQKLVLPTSTTPKVMIPPLTKKNPPKVVNKEAPKTPVPIKPIAAKKEEDVWSDENFQAPSKDDKYTYVVRMDRKPGEQPYFILTANPTKLSSAPELTGKNVGVICKDVYRSEVAKKKATSNNAHIGLYSWAERIIWLKNLNLPENLLPCLKQSADKVLKYGSMIPAALRPKATAKTAEARTCSTEVPVKPVSQTVYILPKPSATTPVIIPQIPAKTTPISLDPTPQPTVSNVVSATNMNLNRTEIIYQQEKDDIFDIQCVSENEDEEEMEIETLDEEFCD